MHDAAIQMDQRLAVFAFPAGQTLPGLLVVLSDAVVADGVQRSRIGSHRLVGFRRGNASHLFALPRGQRGARDTSHAEIQSLAPSHLHTSPGKPDTRSPRAR